MRARLFTKAFVLTFVILAIIYDIVVFAIWGVHATVSRVALSWSHDIPIVLVGVGVLIGHLFWPQPPQKKQDFSEHE